MQYSSSVKPCALSLYILLLINCRSVKAQETFSAKSFKGSVWAATNQDDLFFKSDTIRLVRLGDKHFDASNQNAAEYFKGHDFLTIRFDRRHKFSIFLTDITSWSITEKTGKYYWSFDDHSQVLKLFYNNTLLLPLAIISTRQVEIKSNYTHEPAVTSTEIVFHKIP